jgi:hypothetical protein
LLVANDSHRVLRLERCVERSVAAVVAPGAQPIDRQRLLALPRIRRRLRWEQPRRVSEARPLVAQVMTAAEPLGQAMALAPEAMKVSTPKAMQGVKPAKLHARHGVTPVALHATLKPAAVHATLEARRPAAAGPSAAGPKSHLQPDVRAV